MYRQGAGKLPSALQAALHGLRVGDRKRVTLLPAQAYGAVNPAAFQEVDIQLVPALARKVGSVLVSQDTTGKQRPVRIHAIRDTTVVLDFNHPLAGKTLHFDVRVVDIQQGEQS
jgi:FKBP-type peptidyl-prolyl cis-trans isomerase 2